MIRLRHLLAATGLTSFATKALAAIAMGACGTNTICNDATSCSLPPPAGITDGVLLAAFAFAQETSLAGDTFSVTGFTSRGQEIGFASFDRAWLVATKTASGESGNYTLTSSLATSLYDWRGVVCIITGVDTTTPMDAAPVNGTPTSNTGVFDPAAITTVTNGAVVLTIVAANDGSPAGTLTQPSGYTSYVNGSASSRTLGVAYLTKATAGSEDPGNWTGFNATNEIIGGTLALRPSLPPSWDTQPSVQSQTASAYTIAFDGGANAATIWCGAYLKDASTPTAAQIKAGTGAHGTATAAITGSAQTIVLTPSDSPVNPIYDTYCVAESASGEFTLVTDGDLLDEQLDCPLVRNCQWPLASVDMLSPLNGIAATGDYMSIDSLTDPTAYATILGTDGVVSYPSGGSTTRQIIGGWLYKVATAIQTTYLFVFNNLAPLIASTGDWPLLDVIYEINTNPAFFSEDFVTDPEGDDITWAVGSGSMPTDWVLNATTGEINDGTPGACGNYTFALRATDEYGSYTDFPSLVHIHTRIPNVAGDDAATATAAIEAICTLDAVVSPQNGCGITVGNVVRTIPAINELVPGDTQVALVLSTQAVCQGGGSGLRMRDRLKIRGRL